MTGSREVACLGCDQSVTESRAVVDVATGRRLGDVCETCLRRRFGWTITDGTWQRETGCAVCQRDAWYVLDPSEKPTNSGGVEEERVPNIERHLALCDEHLHGVLSEENARHAGPSSDGPPGPRASRSRRR